MENNNELTLKQKVLAHYDRMIEWARKQDPSASALSDFMYDDLGEYWYGSSCPLCNLFYNIDAEEEELTCEKCPIFERTGKSNCYDSPYYGMVHATCWEDWIAAALRERAFLESLDYEEEKVPEARIDIKATLHVFPDVESRDSFLNEHVGPDDIVMHGHGKESNHAE